MLAHAQELVYNLSELMPTQYQKQNLEAMLGLFLEAQGHPLPEYSQIKSPSALSRFLNINPWSRICPLEMEPALLPRVPDLEDR